MHEGISRAKTGKRSQLGFDLAVRRADYRRCAFVVTSANEPALVLALRFLQSTEQTLVITGPRGSGKTHLLHILAEQSGACMPDGRGLPEFAADEAQPLLIDDAERTEPKALLALLENARARGSKVVLTGQGSPRLWAHGLRDLETRLDAMARVSLDEPDEDLLRAVIVQRFRERQWRAADSVAGYVAPRIPRTFAAAETFVEAAGTDAIALGKPITLGLARKIVENLFEGGSKS